VTQLVKELRGTIRVQPRTAQAVPRGGPKRAVSLLAGAFNFGLGLTPKPEAPTNTTQAAWSGP